MANERLFGTSREDWSGTPTESGQFMLARGWSIWPTDLIIPRSDFLNELKKMKRTKIAEVVFDKHLLGSNALNFSNRTVSLRKDIKLIATAEKKESITELALDIYNNFQNKNSHISKIRIYGNDNENNEVVLDTSFMSRIEILNLDINRDTGEVITGQILNELVKIANSF